MADWDTSKPGDSDRISVYPANERAAREAAKDNFDIEHFADTGTNQGKHRQVSLIGLGDLPDVTSTAALEGRLVLAPYNGELEWFLIYRGEYAIRLSQNGAFNIDLAEAAIEAQFLTAEGESFAGYFRSRKVDLAIDSSGVLSVDWHAAQFFEYTNTETHTIEFSNLPLIGGGVGQAIMLTIHDAGNFGITLDPGTGYTVYRRSADDLGALTTDGTDKLICTVDEDGIVNVVPLLDFVSNV